MKVGDKLYCISSYYIGNHIYENIDKQHLWQVHNYREKHPESFIKGEQYVIENIKYNRIIIENVCFSYIKLNFNNDYPYFKNFFLTKKELRKRKLNKLKNERNS